MGILSGLGFGNKENIELELENLFPLSVSEVNFIHYDTVAIFSKILIDVIERTQGIPKEAENLMWDNCVAGELPDGLITLVSKAMTDRKDLFLVYEPALKLIRKATSTEEAQIKTDYKAKGISTVGAYISFKHYLRADLIKLYSALEYCTIGGLNKSMRLSNAIQIKINDLRSSVGLSDAADAKAQGLKIANGLKLGKDVMLDAKDIIETATPDLSATDSAMERIEEKRAFYLGMPASYLTGEVQKGLGDTGQADAKAVERGLRGYFFSIIKPIFEALFKGAKIEFKSEDFQQIDSAMNALKTFDLTSNDFLSAENKTGVINKLLGLPEDEKGDPPKPEPVPVVTVPARPGQQPPPAKPPFGG